MMLMGETYPGAEAQGGDRLLQPFAPSDVGRAWGLDFHYPHGILPLGHELLAIVTSSSRRAAEALPAVTGRGLESRVIGTHVYTAGIAVLEAHERAERAAAAAPHVAAYPDAFPEEWRRQTQMLDEEFRAQMAVDLTDASSAALRRAFEGAVAHFSHAWDVHFDVMYRLLAAVDVFRTVCRALGIDDATSADLISSGDTAIRRTDDELRRLARAARSTGLTDCFQLGTPVLPALERHRHSRAWRGQFDAFLSMHGHRTNAIVDVAGSSWVEDPEQPLGCIRDLLLSGSDMGPDDLAGLERARLARADDLAGTMRGADRAVFLRSLAVSRRANFALWNEDHNAVIDLRAHLPVRRVARALARRAGRPADEGLLLFGDEVRRITAGEQEWPDALARRDYYDQWRAQRATMSRSFGVPSQVNDPVMAEILGLAPQGKRLEGNLLEGLGSSPGTARGRARVVGSADELHRVQAGDVLVCEATSPSWTPVFSRLAACVCDSGGVLTHAAIICREYGLPCVSAVGVATRVIRDGDLIEVDGLAGTVTIIESPG